jgi:hypothetical protein
MYVTSYELTKRHSAQGVCIQYGEGNGVRIEAALDESSLALGGVSRQARQARQGCWTWSVTPEQVQRRTSSGTCPYRHGGVPSPRDEMLTLFLIPEIRYPAIENENENKGRLRSSPANSFYHTIS